MVNYQTFSKRRKKFLEFSNNTLEITEKKFLFCYLPYIPRLSEKLKRFLEKNGLKVAYKLIRGSNTLASFLNSGKDRTSAEQESGIYKIPCNCGSSYVGQTNQNLKMRLLLRHNSISSSLKQNSKPEDFTSGLSEHIYDYTNHLILFENVSLISRDQGLKQIFREPIETKKKILYSRMIP